MDSVSPQPADRRSKCRIPLTPTAAIVLAVSFGLCAGYLDVVFIVVRKFFWNPEGYYRTARDFPWSVPVAHTVLTGLAGVAVAAGNRLRPRLLSLGTGAWLLATVAIWAALLRLPLYGAASLVLAAGIGRLVADLVAVRGLGARRMRRAPLAFLGVLGVLAMVSSGRQALVEYRVVEGLRPPPPGARNVVLIVWDTVRAYSLGSYGSTRDTTPNLRRWARNGVQYNYSLAPAPWTFPSHSCFFTGQWPLRINTQWKMTLDTRDPTLAEYLSSRGYQTAGFVANTSCCTYETGLERGFAHFEDYTLTPWSILARTVPGEWIVTRILRLGGWYHDAKWAGLQSRDASAINGAFLDWLGRRQPDRPFFAFLNYFDAHEPYVPPAGFVGRFGIPPKARRDFEFLMDYLSVDKRESPTRDILMARDCYDACIAYLDEQLGRLLDELKRQGLLANTDIIITSDHGEAFGNNGMLGHCFSVNLDETAVPLVMLSPGAPAGKKVSHPVSLRDLPATVVDRLGLSAGSPFPGRSLAVYWELPAGPVPPDITSPAFSEQVSKTESHPQPGPWGMPPGFEMSIVSANRHYIRDGEGNERLYDLLNDWFEHVDLLKSSDGKREVEPFRRMLLNVLTDNQGSVEVERGYLKHFRETLRSLVGPARERSSPPRHAKDTDSDQDDADHGQAVTALRSPHHKLARQSTDDKNQAEYDADDSAHDDYSG
jgi:arylsulfatase A-like enzyme